MKFLLAAILLLPNFAFAEGTMFETIVGKWYFHYTYQIENIDLARWTLAAQEFYPNGTCSSSNLPAGYACTWGQEATVINVLFKDPSGREVISWNGTLASTNLAQAIGSVGGNAAATLHMLRDVKGDTAGYHGAPMRSLLGFWQLLYKKDGGSWVSNRLYLSYDGSCSINDKMVSCAWDQNLKEARITLRLSNRTKDELNFFTDSLDPKAPLSGKIVDGFQTKKKIGEFYLNQ
jgi:hypothetical protein